MTDDTGDNSTQRALALLQAGQLEAAAVACEAATRRRPDDAEAWCLLGTALGMLGAHERAIAACRHALRLRPRYAEAWCNLGASLADLQQANEAIDAYREALAVRPAYPGVLYNLGNLYRQLGRADMAIASYRSALAVGADDPAIYLNLGLALADKGLFAEAIDHYRRALGRRPDFAEAHNNLGVAHAALNQIDQAVPAYRQALRCHPRYAEAHNNLGAALATGGNITAAIESFHAAQQIAPQFAPALNGLGNAMLKIGRQREALTAFREACRLDPLRQDVQHNLLFALNYAPELSPDAIAAEHLAWGRSQAAVPTPRFPNLPDPARPLRIGYISPDFRAHSVAHFILPVLRHHDPHAVEVYCYANVRHPDGVTDHLRSLAHHWRPVYGMADSDVVDQMRTDNIDVLVDLAGHSADNRLGVLASRAAPVQASYLGYPNTTGLSAVDYYVTDDILDPSGASESRYSERLTRLSTFCCYEPPDNAPAIAPTPAANTDHVTFGGLHNLAKINTDVIRVWTRILHALPDSRLLLQSAVFTDPVVRNDWLERFAAAGIHRTRLLLRDHTNFVDHLRLHAGIDVALDVFPWSGHTATCHTLWMGVPVVALHGSCHAGRMAARVLRSIGLDELVAKDEQDYVDIAVALALDAARRNALRSTLRDRMLASPLCDAPAHVRELEAAYRDMWMTWCAKRNR